MINNYLDGKGINIDYNEMINIIENLKEPVMMTLGYYAMLKARRLFARKKYVKDIYEKD